MIKFHYITEKSLNPWKMDSCSLQAGVMMPYLTNYVPIESNSQKVFLSWQTWDLMRLTFYGFKDFTDSFFRRHPSDEHYIIPVMLNGNAVETLFSQLKYSAGGHLSSTNYASARSSLLVKRQVR